MNIYQVLAQSSNAMFLALTNHTKKNKRQYKLLCFLLVCMHGSDFRAITVCCIS